NKQNRMKACFLILIISILTITMIPFTASCAKETIFGSLTLCGSVNKDTFEPVDPKNEFDLFDKNISAAINIQNVKGTDLYRFLWKNEQTGEIFADVSGKYKEGETRYLEGWFASSVFPEEGADVIALPGNYLVEFYHNGVLNTSAKFTIKEPVSKILSVSLASEVNDIQEPLKTTQEFDSGSAIYACVQLNYIIPGDKLLAKWFDESGNVLFENPLELKDSFYQTSWIAFTLESANDKPLPEGNYKVEIYLNDVKYNEFLFTISVASGQAATDISFDKGNIFTEAESKYYFSISYPDNCEYNWQEYEDGMSVNFNPLSENDAYSTMMIVTVIETEPTEEDYNSFADEISQQTAAGVEGMKQTGERTVADGNLPDGTPYKEYTYYFNDADGLEYGLILDLIPINGMFYVWYGFANETFYNQLNSSYYGSLATLEFK
ncbi:MAG: hypothetical protein ACYCXK_11565, partial [Candidatus Humimicrobiaceae bacterium]